MGSLPTFPFQGVIHYMAGGDNNREDPKLRWHPAAFHRSAIVPVIDTSLERFLKFMEEPNEVEGDTLYVAIRSFARLETTDVSDLISGRMVFNSLFVAAAIVPGTIEGAVPHPWRYEPLSTLAQLCTIIEAETEPEEPLLKAAWLQLAEGREQNRQWREIQGRALRLLEAHLDEGQLSEFQKQHRFRVQGADGLVYLITYETHGNIWQIETAGDGKTIPRTNYCIVPQEEIPIYDQMLAQKFLIETDLDGFKRIANAKRFNDEGKPEDTDD